MNSSASYICGINSTIPGTLRIIAGCSTDTGASGSLLLCGGCGTSTSGTGGNADLCAGIGKGSSSGGQITICAGASGTGAGGTININAGNSTSGTDGDIYMRANGIDKIRVCGSVGCTTSYVGVYWYNARKIMTTSAGVTVCSAVACVSDERLKECVEPITSALSMVQQLSGVCFNWREDGRQSMGFIAQDVEPITPRLVERSVTGDDDEEKFGITDDVYTLNYGGFTPLLVEAMKEQQKQIEELRTEIEILKGN